jgi:hypothetical protein
VSRASRSFWAIARVGGRRRSGARVRYVRVSQLGITLQDARSPLWGCVDGPSALRVGPIRIELWLTARFLGAPSVWPALLGRGAGRPWR